MSGDGGVVKTGETAPTTIRLSLQLSLDCSVNFSQAPSNKNYKEEQIFIFGKKIILDPVISITVNVQGVSGWTVLVTCRANETPSL